MPFTLCRLLRGAEVVHFDMRKVEIRREGLWKGLCDEGGHLAEHGCNMQNQLLKIETKISVRSISLAYY